MSPFKLLPLLALPLLVACSDERATFPIDGNTQHALTVIRQQQTPWARKGDYVLVAMRMPECMRRHKMETAGLETPIEVFSPGNNAWILRQGRRMYVVETRSCEGFARLEGEPEGGFGQRVGTFRSVDGEFSFVPETPAPAPSPSPAPEAN